MQFEILKKYNKIPYRSFLTDEKNAFVTVYRNKGRKKL